MALKLDNTLLEELGLGQLPDAEKQLLLRQIYEKLEMNVGMRLADQMSNEQLDAFEKFVDANDDKGAFQWLEQNFPNYKLVVNEEFEKLKSEIRSVAPQILSSAQFNQPQQNPQAQPVQQSAQVPQSGQPQPYQQPQSAPVQQPDLQMPSQQAGPAPLAQPVSQPIGQQQAQPQPQSQPIGQSMSQPQQPYQQPQQYQPNPAATPQAGHLQPQYGYNPNDQPPLQPTYQPNQGQPQYSQQPPAGPPQNS